MKSQISSPMTRLTSERLMLPITAGQPSVFGPLKQPWLGQTGRKSREVDRSTARLEVDLLANIANQAV